MADCDPRRVFLGELNPYEYRKGDPKVQNHYKVKDRSGIFSTVKQAIEHIYTPRAAPLGPFKAICLRVAEATANEPGIDNGFILAEALGFHPRRHIIWARVPEMSAGIPDPCIYSNSRELTEEDGVRFANIFLHPRFLSRTENAKGFADPSLTLPKPGDIIWVDFEDVPNQLQGIYLGKAGEGSGGMPECSTSATSFNDGESAGTVNSTSNVASDAEGFSDPGECIDTGAETFDPIDMTTSDSGKDFIMGEEGVRYTVYFIETLPHIGVGHLIYKPGDTNELADFMTSGSPDEAETLYSTNYTQFKSLLRTSIPVFTDAQVDELFTEDLQKFEDVIKRKVNVKLTQNQFDALVSLVYNIGSGNFSKSRVLSNLNEGDCAGAASAFSGWTKSSGQVNQVLVKRRSKEAERFSS